MKYLSVLLVLLSFLTACGPQPPTAASNAPSAISAGSVEDQASLIDSLRDAGASVNLGDTVNQPFFSVSGQIVMINDTDIQVFEYTNAELMEVEAGLVSPDGDSFSATPTAIVVTWIAAPHFYKTGRIIVLYVGDDAAVLDLLKSVLGAQFAGR